MPTYYRALSVLRNDPTAQPTWVPDLEIEEDDAFIEMGLIDESQRNAEYATCEPGEVLAGASWPCRLFVVEPCGEPFASQIESHLTGCAQWNIVAEVDPWRAFGPHGKAVLTLLDQIQNLTDAQAEAIVRAGDVLCNARGNFVGDIAGDAATLLLETATREIALDTAASANREAAYFAAVEAVYEATTARALAESVPITRGTAPLAPGMDTSTNTIWGVAQVSAMDAVRALVVADLLPQEHFVTLAAPWLSIMWPWLAAAAS